MCRVDNDQVSASLHQAFAALITGITNCGGCSDTQTALLVLDRIGMEARLLDILDRNQADAAIVFVDDEELFNPV